MADRSGNVAFITGSGNGIGEGTAERLAPDEADICIAEIVLRGAEETASMVRGWARELGRQAWPACDQHQRHWHGRE